MRSPTHFDEVAARHGDRLTRWFEDAVDEADDEAEVARGLGRRTGDASHPADSHREPRRGGDVGPTTQATGERT